jgi:hypothetical protein
MVMLLFAGSLATFCGVCIWATRSTGAEVDAAAPEIPDTVPTEWADLYRP